MLNNSTYASKFLYADVRDMNVRQMQLAIRVLPRCHWLCDDPDFGHLSFMLEVIIQGSHGQMYFGDWICDGPLTHSVEPQRIGRYVNPGETVEIELWNGLAKLIVRVRRLMTGELRWDIGGKQVKRAGEWKRPRLAA